VIREKRLRKRGARTVEHPGNERARSRRNPRRNRGRHSDGVGDRGEGKIQEGAAGGKEGSSRIRSSAQIQLGRALRRPQTDQDQNGKIEGLPNGVNKERQRTGEQVAKKKTEYDKQTAKEIKSQGEAGLIERGPTRFGVKGATLLTRFKNQEKKKIQEDACRMGPKREKINAVQASRKTVHQ